MDRNDQDEAAGLTAPSLCLRRHPGITSGLMKGALSVAASAYKALFTGQGPTQVAGERLNTHASAFTLHL